MKAYDFGPCPSAPDDSGDWYRRDDVDAALAALRAELAAMTARAEAAEQVVKKNDTYIEHLTMWRDFWLGAAERMSDKHEQHSYAARRVAAYCRGLRAELAEVLSAAAALRVAGGAARDALGAELAALRAELAAESEKSKDLTDQLLYLTDYYDANDYEAAEERVILMRRDNQRAAAARRVAEYCRGLHAELDGLELERAEIARRVAAYYRQRKPK